MPLDIDTSDMDPGTRAQVEMFATMVGAMPTEAIESLIELLIQERDSRNG